MPAAASGRWSRRPRRLIMAQRMGRYMPTYRTQRAESSSAVRCSLGSLRIRVRAAPVALPACPGPTARGTLNSAGPSPGDHCRPHTALYQPCAWIAVCVFKLQSGHFAPVLAPRTCRCANGARLICIRPSIPRTWHPCAGKSRGAGAVQPRKAGAVGHHARSRPLHGGARSAAAECRCSRWSKSYVCPASLTCDVVPVGAAGRGQRRAALVGAANGLHKACPNAVGPRLAARCPRCHGTRPPSPAQRDIGALGGRRGCVCTVHLAQQQRQQQLPFPLHLPSPARRPPPCHRAAATAALPPTAARSHPHRPASRSPPADGTASSTQPAAHGNCIVACNIGAPATAIALRGMHPWTDLGLPRLPSAPALDDRDEQTRMGHDEDDVSARAAKLLCRRSSNELGASELCGGSSTQGGGRGLAGATGPSAG